MTRDPRPLRPQAGRRALSACFLALVGAIISATVARGGERVFPVARITIYPGDRIDDSMLDERVIPAEPGSERGMIESRDALLGKIARRTLLPGQPVPALAIDNPRIVLMGAHVKIVFSESGLVITAFGMAMQAGGVGDFIRVRNEDSGRIVSGRIQPDGSIRVSEG
jgi:flagella basal body P-ring formation protein FlgA